MVTFKINDIDISNDVMLNTFTYMKRIDDIFGTGSFQFESNTITENIPPYSLLNIETRTYCCSSEATYHFGRGSWFHNVSIIEATALLSRFLVGSKAFSITGTNTYDWEKINVLINLINQKYNANITIYNKETFKTIFNKQIEYVFTAGTTLFDALSEISKQYNVRINVRSASSTMIVIDIIDLANLSEFAFDSSKVLSLTKTQNAETYCKYLESEATNVIDTNQLNVVKNIYATSNDIKLSEDTFIVKLPTPAFKVEKVIARMPSEMYVSIEFDEFPEKWIDEEPETNATRTYNQWTKYFPVLNGLYDTIFSKYEYESDFYSRKWSYDWRTTTITLIENEAKYFKNIPVLSKEKFELLEDKDKPDYVYYTLGSNVIDGFSNIYKNDFWNNLIGTTKEAILFKPIYDNEFQNHAFNGGKITKFEITNEFSSKMNTSFNVEYYPIANPYLLNTKQDIPLNENAYKSYAVSYNKSSNYVDFDKMMKSMEIENQTTGKTEVIVEYDTTNWAFGFDLARKMTIDNKTWYIINSSTTYQNGKQITTFNLVSNYNKVADVISLNSQYNTLKNPLENIIERPLFFETNETFNFVRGATYLKVATYNANKELIANLYMQPIVMTNNNECYLYFEMQDQYNAKSNAVKVSDDVFKVNDVGYVDANNEIDSVRIGLGFIYNLTNEQAQQLPIYSGTGFALLFEVTSSNVYVSKDAREKLTFTIKCNNCIIK